MRLRGRFFITILAGVALALAGTSAAQGVPKGFVFSGKLKGEPGLLLPTGPTR